MIFLDNASTTKPDSEILSKFISYQDYYFNASAGYKASVNEISLINNARNEIIKCLDKSSGNFVFTASSSEANNIIINSLVNNNKNAEYIFTMAEHPSVYNLAEKLKNDGKIVHFIGLNQDGSVNTENLLDLVNENTRFVSVIHVSNETGIMNDINNLAKQVKLKNKNVFFHSDGVQAFGKTKYSLNDFIDAYTISSHKLYGLKGIAGFYIKNLNSLKTFIFGGGQEFNIRSGTTNTPMILSFRDTCLKAKENLEESYDRALKLKNIVFDNLKNESDIVFNSSFVNSSPYIISFSVLNLNAETIMNLLSEREIYVGLGSACSTKKAGNIMLNAMKKNKAEILGNLRVSFSKYTTEEEVEEFCKALKEIKQTLKEKLR